MIQGKQVKAGEHNLVVSHYKHLAGKLCIFHRSLSEPEADFVKRTFIQGSAALGTYTKELLGKELFFLMGAEPEALRGKSFRALILQSTQKPEYMNLVKILKVFEGGPTENLIFNSDLPVNEWKIGGG
jgi:hypothetical protein